MRLRLNHYGRITWADVVWISIVLTVGAVIKLLMLSIVLVGIAVVVEFVEVVAKE